MKKSIFTILLIVIPIFLKGQEWQYSAVINGTGIEPRYSTIDAQGNVYILSYFSGSITNPAITSYGIGDLFLCKMSPTGTLLWYDRIGGTGNDLAGGMNIADGFLYVTGGFNNTCNFNGGTSQLTSAGVTDIFLAKYSLSGEFQYARIVGTFPTVQVTQHIKADNNHQLVMTGYFRDSVKIGYTGTLQKIIKGTPGIVSNFIALLDLEGNCIWAKSISGTHTDSRFQRIGISENGYYFGGFFKGDLTFDLGTISSYVATTFDAFVYKTDFDGNGQWIRRIRGSSTENFKTLTTDEYDNVYVLGNFNSATIYVDSINSTGSGNPYAKSPGTSYDTYMAKYNRSGVLQWFLIRGGTGKDIYNDFVIRNNVIYATGYFADQIIFNNDTLHTDNALNEDAFLAAFNEIGNPISGISIKGTGNYNDAGSIVRMDANSRAYVAGYFKSPQIQIGSEIYTSGDVNASDQFFAVFKQPFKAVITDKRQVSCYGKSDGMLTVTPYFGKPPYTYSWSHNAGLNNPVADNLPAGSYTVTITDANDSITSTTDEVMQNAPLSIGGIVTPVSCVGGSNGAVDITVSGGKSDRDYSYFWTSLNGSGIDPLQQDQSGLTDGTYTVEVKDANNCADTTDFVVIEPQPFNFTGTQVTKIVKPIVPSGMYGAIDLAVSGGNTPYGFAWTGPNGFTASTENIANLDSAGLYNLTLTDSKNCTADTSFTVIDNFSFVAEIRTKTDVTCFGANDGTATVKVYNGTAPFSYQWSDGPLLSDSVRTGMQPNTYIVTVTDAALKTSQARVKINGPSTALVIVLNPDNLRCNGDNSGVIDLTVTGGSLPYSFSWSNGYTGEDLVNVPADVYTVIVTDAYGCSKQDTKTVDEPAEIGLSAAVTKTLNCYGNTDAIATATATGGTPPGSFSYLWDDPGAQITPVALGLSAGNYTVTVTDSNNCSKTAPVEVIQPVELKLSNVIVVDPSCPGSINGSIVPTYTGGTGTGYEYVWSNVVFTRINSDIPSGQYILTVNDDNNCFASDTFNLADPDVLNIDSIHTSDVTCLGKTDGSVTIFATGGTGILEYSADNGSIFVPSSVIGSLPAGDYTAVVRDANECPTNSIPFTLSITDTVAIDTVIVTDATCLGVDNGSLQISAYGGTGIYEYSTDGGTNYGSNDLIASLSAGNYSVIVRDDQDCLSEQQGVVITYDDTVKITAVTHTDVTCDDNTDGTITITATGGTREYQYSVDDGDHFAGDSTVTALPQGNYSVVVRDVNQCVSEATAVTLIAPESCGLIIYDAISPNGDGKNDVWDIENAGPKIKVEIFNIWGKSVFSSSGYSDPWDGKYNGKDLPAGTYYYVIEPGDGSDNITGAVSIVK